MMKHTLVHRRQQTGAGLMTALVLVMLITSIIATVAVVTHYDIRRHRMLRHAETAQGLVDGATKLALDTLLADNQVSEIDTRQELWATPLPAYPVDGGVVRGEIRPLSSAFNLYALKLPVDAQRAQYEQLFRRLASSVDVPLDAANRIIDAMQAQQGDILSPTDLILRLGLDESVTDRLAPKLFFYPVLDGFNVNVLDANMWQVIADIDAGRANSLVNELTRQPVRDANEFVATRLADVTVIKGIAFSAKTRFFEIITEAAIGDMIRSSAVRVFRVSKGELLIMHRRTLE